MNLAKELCSKAKQWSQKTAVVFEGTVYTYAEIDNLVERYCAVLADLGVRVGDRVAIQLPKRMEFIFLELAILSMGGIALPLNSDYTPKEIEYFLSDSGSSLFFTDASRFTKSRRMLGGLRGLSTIVVDPAGESGVISLPDRLKKTPPEFHRTYPTGDDDTAIICYTSGTTGRSKGALITHRNLVSNMTALHETWQWSDRDVLLHVLPLFHVHGLFVALHGGLNAGATIVMHERFDPVRVWRTIESERCTILMGVPTMYQRLMNAWVKRDRPPDLSSMRLFLSGSAPLLENLFARFAESTGFRILERYGMTETGMITSNPAEPLGRRAKSVGYPLPGVEIRIVGSSGEDVTAGEIGEVLVRGDNVFKGYWGMPEKTTESFTEGWFKSGDLGYRDHEDGGRLYLVGREKELIITGGYNVYPKEVENLLESRDGVRESAVIGLPDEDFGERVTAVVALESADSSLTPESLVEFCKKHLAGYKCPKQVIVVDALPRNSMGKLQKGVLVERFRAS